MQIVVEAWGWLCDSKTVEYSITVDSVKDPKLQLVHDDVSEYWYEEVTTIGTGKLK